MCKNNLAQTLTNFTRADVRVWAFHYYTKSEPAALFISTLHYKDIKRLNYFVVAKSGVLWTKYDSGGREGKEWGNGEHVPESGSGRQKGWDGVLESEGAELVAWV